MKQQPDHARSVLSGGDSKRILIVYPHNCTLRNSGINARYYELAKYFTRRGFLVDQLGLQGFVDEWPASRNINNRDIQLEELFLYDFQKGLRELSLTAGHWKKVISRFFFKRPGLKHCELPDFAFKGMREYFDMIVGKRHYDYILISYAYWANLIEDRSYPNTTLVLEISDFLTLNLFDAEDGHVDVGALLNEELRRIDLFDRVFCINEEELRFFSRLSKKPKYFYVPHFMAQPEIDRKEFAYDVCIVASDNQHNIKGIRWFYDEIMPLLSPQLRYLVVGKISAHLPRALDNVTVMPYADDLRNVYNTSRIAICPLLGGTGMKIKVVEALAHGVPVVCTSLGVIGFADRQLSGCSVADEAAAFAGLILRLTEDGDYYREQSALARRCFMSNFELSHVHEVLDKVFD